LNQGIKSSKKTEKNYSATVGFDFFPFNIKIEDTIIKLNVCKPNDDEKYRSLINENYKNCSLVIILYAIDE
jgi:GTPase SAR1 family protein